MVLDRLRRLRRQRRPARPATETDAHHDTIWVGIGPALLTLGIAAIGVPYGILESAENPHPSVWSNPWFVGLFLLGSLSLAAGAWVLASFFWPLWLPQTRRQRDLTRRVAAHSHDSPAPATAEKEKRAVFDAVEAEIALAREEALEMAKLLRVEWPHISVDGALVETALPDWRAKTTDFIGTVLGAAQRAAFKASETGSDVLERLESEGRFLEGLSTSISADSIRTDEADFLAAQRKRRDHDAARFLVYDHHRAPGAPPLAGQSDQQNAPVPLADELARMIDEGRGLAGDVYSGSPTWGQFDSWRGKIAEFVGVALGAVEKQRVLEVKPEQGDKPRDHVLAVVAWLRERRDQSDSLVPLLAGEELIAAIEARRGAQQPGGPDPATTPARELRLHARNAQRRNAAVADLFKEGDTQRLRCLALPEGTSQQQIAWRLGQPPKQQCAREDAAREWDKQVSDYLWAVPELKQFGPGWQAAGAPIRKAQDHPKQSMMNPDRLAQWYQGKLDYLKGILDSSLPAS